VAGGIPGVVSPPAIFSKERNLYYIFSVHSAISDEDTALMGAGVVCNDGLALGRRLLKIQTKMEDALTEAHSPSVLDPSPGCLSGGLGEPYCWIECSDSTACEVECGEGYYACCSCNGEASCLCRKNYHDPEKK